MTALSNVEAKKRFEFLEAVSGTMDAHLRYFKQVWIEGRFCHIHMFSTSTVVLKPFSMCRVTSCCIKWNPILIRFVAHMCVYCVKFECSSVCNENQ